MKKSTILPLAPLACPHVNVENAFNAAPALAVYLKQLGAQGLKITTGAHSLGNMAVTSALWDWEVGHDIVDRHMAFDAAIAIEALDGTAAQQANMLHGDWYDHGAGVPLYPEGTMASEWHQLFKDRTPVVDLRDELTWRDRFNNMYGRRSLPSDSKDPPVKRWWNFYSEGEDVLNNVEHDTHSLFVNGLLGRGEYTWGMQEKYKGRGKDIGNMPVIARMLYGENGGWRFYPSDQWPSLPSPLAEDLILIKPEKTIVNAKWNAGDRQVFRARPVFHKGPSNLSFLYDDIMTPEGDSGYRVPDAFFAPVGLNGYTPNKILADMIPARTFAAGRNEVRKISQDIDPLRNIDMNTMKINGWPSERDNYRWKHGDIRDVSYYYTYEVYGKLVIEGNLK